MLLLKDSLSVLNGDGGYFLIGLKQRGSAVCSFLSPSASGHIDGLARITFILESALPLSTPESSDPGSALCQSPVLLESRMETLYCLWIKRQPFSPYSPAGHAQ